MRRIRTAFMAALIACVGCGETKDTSGGDNAATPGLGGKSTTPVAPSGPSGGKAVRTQSGKAVNLPPASVHKDNLKFVVAESAVKTTFDDVVLADNTVVVDAAAMTSVGGGPGEHVFDTNGLAGAFPKAGQLLLVPGRTAGKVVSVKADGDTTVITTEFASIPEIFHNAKLGWKGTLPISADNLSAMIMPDGREVPLGRSPPQYAALDGLALPAQINGPMEWSFVDGKLTYKTKLRVTRDFIDVQLEVKRKMANTGGMRYTANIRVAPLKVFGDAQIKDGKTQGFEISQDDLGAEIYIDIAAAGGGTAKISKTLPMPVFKWIIPVGGIPLTITAKARVIGQIDLPAKGSAIATARLDFNGTTGFKLVGQQIKAKVDMSKSKFSPEKFDSAGPIGGAVDAQFGVAFPVLSMSIWEQGFIPELIPGATVGSRLQWGPVCKTGYLKYTLKAAWKLKVFALTIAQEKKTLWEKEKRSNESCK